MKKILFLVALSLLTACSGGDDSGPEPTNVTAATISSSSTSNVTDSTITLEGNITSDGGGAVTARGAVWSTSSNPTLDDNIVNSGNGEGMFTVVISNLQPDTQYFVRLFATNSSGTSYTNELTLTTAQTPGPVFQGNVELNTQTDVNEFGTHGYSGITGSLRISEQQSITDLTPLSTLTFIGDRLQISGIANLESLNGLENIETVGNEIRIESTDLLTNLSPLNVNLLQGRLIIQSNDSLLNLDGIAVPSALSTVFIAGNLGLQDITSLNNLTSVANEMQFSGNDQLTTLSGLENLFSVGNLTIRFSAINSLEGLQNLTIAQNFELKANGNLTSLNGLNNLTNVEFDFIIELSENLTTLQGISSLSDVGQRFIIRDNSSLVNIDGLDSLINLTGELVIEENPLLENLNGLNNLSNALLAIWIMDNLSLTDFCGLTNLLENDDNVSLQIFGNAYDPTEQDIIDGNCSI